MSTNPTVVALTALLVSLVTAATDLFKLPLSNSQTGDLTTIIGGALSLGLLAYAGWIHHNQTKLAIARTQGSLIASAPDQGDATSTAATAAHVAQSRPRTAAK